jgi:hypothetical protein
MKRTTMSGLALLGAFAIVAVSAVSVSASGHEFVASKTGKTKGKATNAQVFKTSAGTLECAHVASTGEVTALKSAVHKETLTYTACIAFGYPSVKITPAHFEYNANGSAKLESSVTITPEGSGCKIVIPAQTVETVTYENTPAGQITARANVLNIHSKGTGGVCGAENSEGSYSGSVAGELEGGTVEWR